MPNPLTRRLHQLAHQFFPRARPRWFTWTARPSKLLEFDERTGSGYRGVTLHDSQTVLVAAQLVRPPVDWIGVDALLVHELVHVVMSRHHGEPFRRRLAAAERRAYRLGLEAVADRIAEDLRTLATTAEVSEEVIYVHLADAVRAGIHRWDQLLQAVSDEIGLAPSLLARVYPDLKRAFKKLLAEEHLVARLAERMR